LSNLIQTISGYDYSLVDSRCINHDGCIVDLGCLYWDWCNFFISKKRIIGADPFEEQTFPLTSDLKERNTSVELFKGLVSDYNGTIKLSNHGICTSIFNVEGHIECEVITWKSFIQKFDIRSISVLKINIEGGEWGLIESMDSDDLSAIDQIAVSFHDAFHPQGTQLTEKAIKKLTDHNFLKIPIFVEWGWYLFLKN
jgi:FkbM family methyltransferase